MYGQVELRPRPRNKAIMIVSMFKKAPDCKCAMRQLPSSSEWHMTALIQLIQKQAQWLSINQSMYLMSWGTQQTRSSVQ